MLKAISILQTRFHEKFDAPVLLEPLIAKTLLQVLNTEKLETLRLRPPFEHTLIF
ncbi:hypothetical protein AN958_00040 [Leucoagaricus sp. SymC.cos]|nr:hypothetical protein AN958_00040 [Leucoagaricus sp. SymC.cos]